MSDNEKKDVNAEEKRLAAEKAKAAAKAQAAAVAKSKAAAAAIVKTNAKAGEEAQKEIGKTTLDDGSEPNFEPEVFKATTPENSHGNADGVVEKVKELKEVKDQTEKTDLADGAEKAKAAAAAKAKAAAAVKAKAKAAAAAKAKAGGEGKTKSEGAESEAPAGTEDDEKAKAIAIAKAKAAAAAKARAAKAAGPDAEESAEPKKPSVNQPLLDKYIKVISDNIGQDVIEESYINDKAKEVPTLVIKNESWFEVAQFVKHNEQLAFDYLSNLHGTDFETHMEVSTQFYSYKEKQPIAIRVKCDRENAVIASITPLWEGANWPERETYDLLGIRFEGHPNLTRILLTDDWEGYPMRKDYEQFDEEV